jgi:hypothetical protein
MQNIILHVDKDGVVNYPNATGYYDAIDKFEQESNSRRRPDVREKQTFEMRAIAKKPKRKKKLNLVDLEKMYGAKAREMKCSGKTIDKIASELFLSHHEVSHLISEIHGRARK